MFSKVPFQHPAKNLHAFAAFTVARVLSIRNDKNPLTWNKVIGGRCSLTNIPVTSRPEVVITYADLYVYDMYMYLYRIRAPKIAKLPYKWFNY